MDEVLAVVDEAHKNNLKVVGHSHRPEEIRRGVKAGVDNFEHTGLSSAPEYPPDVMAMLEERTAQMNLGPLYWTPTVSILFNYEYMRDFPEMLDDPSWKEGLSQDIIDDILSQEPTSEELEFMVKNRVAAARYAWHPRFYNPTLKSGSIVSMYLR